MNEKDRRLAGFCRSRRVDGVVLRKRANIAWVTDGVDVHCDTASERGVATVVWTPRAKRGPMGYEPRDFKATRTETRIVAANQAVGWNPSITGTKSEDTILSDGEVLTHAGLADERDAPRHPRAIDDLLIDD